MIKIRRLHIIIYKWTKHQERYIKYDVGNKFILKGDKVDPNNKPDEAETTEG